MSFKAELHCKDIFSFRKNGWRILFIYSFISIFFICSRPDSGVGLLPTSHVKVSRGRVAHAFHIRRHALVLPLVSLLAVLDLQGTWEMTTSDKDETRDREREEMRAEREMISQSVSDLARRSQTIFLMEGILNFSEPFCQELFLSAMLMRAAMTDWVPSPASQINRGEI